MLTTDDHSRVCLQQDDREDAEDSDYINANYIDVSCVNLGANLQ